MAKIRSLKPPRPAQDDPEWVAQRRAEFTQWMQGHWPDDYTHRMKMAMFKVHHALDAASNTVTNNPGDLSAEILAHDAIDAAEKHLRTLLKSKAASSKPRKRQSNADLIMAVLVKDEELLALAKENKSEAARKLGKTIPGANRNQVTAALKRLS